MNALIRAMGAWSRPSTQWSPIGLPEGHDLVRVTLRERHRETDVTADHAIVSLNPLVVAIGGACAPQPRLEFTDRISGELLGWLELRIMPPRCPAAAAATYEVRGGGHRCLGWRARAWRLLRRSLRPAGTTGFRMSEAALAHLAILYLLPRPVVYVSVDDGAAANLLPMDLIGALGDSFSLALRLTSPSVETIRDSRRLALGDVAAADCALAYRLGAHHHASRIDWTTLPDLIRSPQYALRLPGRSLRVREYQMAATVDIGSHAWFICHPVSETAVGTGLRLCHTSGIHGHYRARREGLPWVAAGSAP